MISDNLTSNKFVIGGAVAILAAFIIFAGNNASKNIKSIKELKKENQELTEAIRISSNRLDSLKNIISEYDITYDSLMKVKSKVITNYETKIKEVDNTRIVSNDSITKYIASKIRNR